MARPKRVFQMSLFVDWDLYWIFKHDSKYHAGKNSISSFRYYAPVLTLVRPSSDLASSRSWPTFFRTPSARV